MGNRLFAVFGANEAYTHVWRAAVWLYEYGAEGGGWPRFRWKKHGLRYYENPMCQMIKTDLLKRIKPPF